MIIEEENYIAHYGILRRSGRYPYGSSGWGEGSDKPDYPWSGGETVSERAKGFLDYVSDMLKEGLNESQIAEGVGISPTELRATKTIAKNEYKASQIAQAQRLRDKGTSLKAISERMGVPEPTVRSYLKPGADDRIQNIRSITNRLKEAVDKDTIIDIGLGIETQLGVSREKVQAALVALKDQGYTTHVVPIPQLTTDKDTKTMVLTPPGFDQRKAFLHRQDIKQINDYSNDGGRTFLGIHPPLSISQKRLAINWDEDGGSAADGVIYVREGVPDLSLGGDRYSQVRILVDGTHYIKGMAIYKEGLPKGVDLVFNTNKSRSDDKLDALKKITEDPTNPFGSSISRQIVKKDKDGNEVLTSAMNIVQGEGKWLQWRDSSPSQILSKQTPALAKQQLDMLYEKHKEELKTIDSLTNPIVKRKLLEAFAASTDSKAAELKGAKFPGQAWQVLLPVESLKDNEVYAPNFKNGDRVALIRFPHGGTFEIPDLIVNNRNREGKNLLGNEPQDAIGVNFRVAAKMSGADFDGDAVIVVPNNDGKIRSSPSLEGLKNFDPIRAFPKYEGMKVLEGANKQREMGIVSNLITDMTLRNASTDKIVRAVKHSMVVIDAEKHELNWKESARVNGIAALKAEFQSHPSRPGRAGASTLLSRAGADDKRPKEKLRLHQDGGPVDTKTGELIWVPTGETYVNKKGERVPKLESKARLARTKDAFDLIDGTGTRMERIYATHANKMKALANEARLKSIGTPVPKVNTSPLTKAAYAKEMGSLDAKLAALNFNKPKERQALLIANAMYRAEVNSRPGMDKSSKMKAKALARDRARINVGLDKAPIKIEPREWEAIQSGVISANKLTKILAKADMEQIKEYAMPKDKILMTATKTARAKQMLANGYTRKDVAAQLGVSLSTLDRAFE